VPCTIGNKGIAYICQAMLQSMTGYGRSEGTLKDYSLTIEIKSLNGKQLELNQRLPVALRPFEIQIKSYVQQHLQRGSVEVNMNLKQNGSSKAIKLNTELASFYYNAVKQLSTELNAPLQDPLAAVLQLPEVVAQVSDEFDANDWPAIETVLAAAAKHLNDSRSAEGNSLEKHLVLLMTSIEKQAVEVEQYEGGRIEKQKAKLHSYLSDAVGKENVDNNRFEQELIFYLEKLDISEEKVRLQHHINYFREIMASDDKEQIGKKLGFVLQEVGREINTMGSKANDANIQKLVVQMKDDLEKAKEQILNVL
jgi:uncharacterized protein (TIGR00255 family)